MRLFRGNRREQRRRVFFIIECKCKEAETEDWQTVDVNKAVSIIAVKSVSLSPSLVFVFYN